MIYLITGVPGSGKSLKAVQMILEWKAAGRTIFADIEGLEIEGVQRSPEDWRDTPEGSVVVYDECQRIFPSTGRAGVADDPRIRAMETHRHTGHDLVFITQAPTFLHHHIRKLVGKHYHVYRAMGLNAATIYSWEGTCSDVDDRKERRRADASRWSYPKDLFKYYKSATVHTHKFKIPKKALMYILAACAAIALAIWLLTRSTIGNYVGMEKDEATPTAAAGGVAMPPPAAGDYPTQALRDLHEAPPVTRSIIGCVSGRFCRCFGSDGLVLALPETTCRDYAEGNLGLPIQIPVSNQGANAPRPPPST